MYSEVIIWFHIYYHRNTHTFFQPVPLGSCRWDPTKRMTPDEGMQHEWITEGRLNKLHPKPRPIRKDIDNNYEFTYRKATLNRTSKGQNILLYNNDWYKSDLHMFGYLSLA